MTKMKIWVFITLKFGKKKYFQNWICLKTHVCVVKFETIKITIVFTFLRFED